MQKFSISIEETVRALSLGRTSVYSLINDGKLDTIKIGRRRLVKVESIRRLLEAQA
jgi:excisionase family DNA binding protein